MKLEVGIGSSALTPSIHPTGDVVAVRSRSYTDGLVSGTGAGIAVR